MKDEAVTTYREVLLKAQGNRWLWPSYIVASVLLVLIPIMKGWGSFGTLSTLLMMFCMFGLAVLLASEHQLYRFNIGAFAVFAVLAWLNSSPTEGIGTYFYTDAQIKRFQKAEQMRLVALEASKIRQKGTAYSQLDYSILKEHLPKDFSSEITVTENKGKVEIQINDLQLDSEERK